MTDTNEEFDTEGMDEQESVIDTLSLAEALEKAKAVLEMVEGYRQEVLRYGAPEEVSWEMASDFHRQMWCS